MVFVVNVALADVSVANRRIRSKMTNTFAYHLIFIENLTYSSQVVY